MEGGGVDDRRCHHAGWRGHHCHRCLLLGTGGTGEIVVVVIVLGWKGGVDIIMPGWRCCHRIVTVIALGQRGDRCCSCPGGGGDGDGDGDGGDGWHTNDGGGSGDGGGVCSRGQSPLFVVVVEVMVVVTVAPWCGRGGDGGDGLSCMVEGGDGHRRSWW